MPELKAIYMGEESLCVGVRAGRYTGSYRIPVFIFLTI